MRRASVQEGCAAVLYKLSILSVANITRSNRRSTLFKLEGGLIFFRGTGSPSLSVPPAVKNTPSGFPSFYIPEE